MKNLSITLATVIALLSLQSCTYSEAQEARKRRSEAPIATAPKPINAYNGIVLDTAYDNTVVFIENADDMEGIAYGHFFQFNGAEITELSIAVPYSLLKYDLDTKLHSIDVKAFLNELNKEYGKANMFVKRKALAGHEYNRADSVLSN
jgi:hypothetical protein